MTRTARCVAPWLGPAIGVVSAAMAMAQAPVVGQEVPSVRLSGTGITQRGAGKLQLVQMKPVQQELRMTDAQKTEQAAIIKRRDQKLFQTPMPPVNTPKFSTVVGSVLMESQAAILANLTPQQRERLDQIHLQADGPFAFTPPERGLIRATGPSFPEQLEMTADQVRRARGIVKEGDVPIREETTFAIPAGLIDPLPTEATVLKVVDSPGFQAAKARAQQAVRDARDRVVHRIEEDVLTDAQRAAYRKRLGPPFDLARLNRRQDERRNDIDKVAEAIGLGGVRYNDPGFDGKVARPTYVGGVRHPRALFDEAHHNQYTAAGRYKPFADLIASDGYQVLRNRERITEYVLRKGDILVIADALGAAGRREPGAANPAFTEAECDAVRDWVKDGGALLLIVDVPPSGAAAECLARRFGVELSNRVTSDPANRESPGPPLVFSRRNHLLGDHPITRGRDDSERLDRVGTFGGQSLKGPEGSTPLLKLGPKAIERVGPDNKTVSAAGRTQGLAFTFGKGRVVVLGEAGALEATHFGPVPGGIPIGMNVPGIDNRQMALNIVHWLSGLLEPREGALKKAG